MLCYFDMVTLTLEEVAVNLSKPNDAYMRQRSDHHHRQVSNISGTVVGNKIVDHSDVVGAAPTPGFIGLGKDNCKTRRETFKFGDLVRLILEIL